MSGIMHWAATLLSGSPWIVALVALLLAASEPILVVGAFVPATTVILAAAAAAGASGHGIAALLAGAFAGAVIGDGISYWIGHRYGPAIERWGPLARRRAALASAKRTVRERGAYAVFAARFLPGVRALVPAAAGMFGLSPVRFYVANVASAAVWAASHVLIPALGGGALSALGGGVAALLIGLGLVLALAWWFVRTVLHRLLGGLGAIRARLHRWAVTREGRAARLLARTLDPEDPAILVALVWAALVAAAATAFAGLAEDVASNDPLVQSDLALSRLIQKWRRPRLDDAMIAITMLGDLPVIVAVAAGAAAWLAWRRAWRTLGALMLALGLTAAFVPFVKATLGRARPLTELYSGADGFSFPSGHATFAAVTLGCLAVMLARPLAAPWRGAVLWGLGALALAIAASRGYLQAHWPSDVAAGLLFGAAMSGAFALAAGSRELRAIGLGGSAALAGLVAAAIHLPSGFGAARESYAPRDLSVPLTTVEWRDGGWRDVPPGRLDIAGDVEAPFLLQWAGDPAVLASALEAAGWARAEAVWSPGRLTQPFGHRALSELAPLPERHLGKAPAAVLTRPLDGEDARLVLRLWPAGYQVGGAPLLVGGLEREAAMRPLDLMTLPVDGTPPPEAAAKLRATLVAANLGDRLRLLDPVPPPPEG